MRRFGRDPVVLIMVSAVLLAPVAAAAQDAPIATGKETNGKAQVEVTSLKRSEGDTMTIRFTIINDNSRDLSLVLGNMKLLDIANRRSYGAGLTSDCRIPSGEKRVCWAMFAAPNGNAKTFNVQFYENFDLIPVTLSN